MSASWVQLQGGTPRRPAGANLVVNTDADQVIVAESRRSSPKIPEITYISGGLEEPAIRDAVCRLIEGGEAASRKRCER